MADDLTVEILRQIRDGITGVREEVHGLGDRLDRMETELKSHGVKLERLDQGLNDLGQFMRGLALDYATYERFHA